MSIIFYAAGNRRSRTLYNAFASGLARDGMNLGVMHAEAYSGVQSDVAVFYGLAGNLKRLYHEHQQAGKTTIFFDLGFWGRHEPDRYTGYHRVVVNALHASVVKTYPKDRFKKFGLNSASEWNKNGRYIVLAGQSEKAAWVYDMQPEEWEREAIKQIRQVTDRPIYYHPKMSWRDAKPIEGTIYWPGPVEEILNDAWALVTHHSNSGLAALMHGVPVFTVDGIARSVARKELTEIEAPRYVERDSVDHFLSGAAYWQWNVDEIARGKLWRHLKTEGVV